MALTALLVLVMMGVAASWARQFPQPDEVWTDLGRRRRLLTLAAMPLAAALAVLAGALMLSIDEGEMDGYGYALILLLLAILLVGCIILATTAASRILAARRRAGSAGSGDEPDDVPRGRHSDSIDVAAPERTQRPDIERYVDEESSALMSSRARFIGWPVWLRLLTSVACATPAVGIGIGVALLLATADANGPPVWVVALMCSAMAVLIYGFAVAYALAPLRVTRYMVRTAGSYPTSAPGHGIWQGGSSTAPRPDDR